MNSVSPGTAGNCPDAQRCLARSIRSFEEATKFHQMKRGVVNAAPPSSRARVSSSARKEYEAAAAKIASCPSVTLCDIQRALLVLPGNIERRALRDPRIDVQGGPARDDGRTPAESLAGDDRQLRARRGEAGQIGRRIMRKA